ncbi:MAG: 50S ribosomal protein L18Ae [Methanomassiliicoccales archaeon PtaU1.Bin030]|jgi:large subunit ribosomal protein LX|nr:MAG: 50S ribosomal protein L18Ae [Methanomassiliicoccales archaeon PtaU1.Bin030]
MKAYRANGEFKTGKFSWQKFSIEIAAENEAGATEQIYSNLGSRHKLNRSQIRIAEIKPIKGDEIISHTVKYLAEGH